MINVETKTWEVISYCDIPEEIAEANSSLSGADADTYVEYSVTSLDKRKGFDDDFSLDDWIISERADLADTTILIHVDY